MTLTIYSEILSKEKVLDLLSEALKSKYVSIDTETNGKDIRDGRGYAQGVSLAWRDTTGEIDALYLPFRHKGQGNYRFEEFKSVLQCIISTKPCIFFNAGFDLVSLETLGLDCSVCDFYDGMLLSYQVSETLPYEKSLDQVSNFWLGEPGKIMKGSELEVWIKHNGWGTVPAFLMAEYASYDAYSTLKIFEPIWEAVKREGTQANWYHRREFVRVIIAMEKQGVRIDTKLCEQMAATGEREIFRISQSLHGLNPSSIKDLPVIFLDELKLPEIISKKTGRRTFNAEAMEQYEEILERRSDQTSRLVLAYRGWQKSVSAYYKPYVNLLSPDGRLRPNYQLHSTKTGRLSCKHPNLQQIPRKGEKPWNGKLKTCFVGEEDYELWEFDYKQLEFRLGAAYAHERGLIEVFNDPTRDIFNEIAGDLHLSRQAAKTLVYALSYAAGPDRIAFLLGISRQAAEKIVNNYNTQYPGFQKISKWFEYTAKTKHKVQLWSGRYRHFQWPESEAFKAFNSVIQGGAADIVERSMLRCNAQGLNNNDCRMLLQVHDSVIFEIRKDLVSLYVPEITNVMQAVKGGDEQDFGVLFGVDAHKFGE